MTSGNGAEVTLNLGGLQQIDHVVIMEDIACGERVRAFTADGWDGEKWVELGSGTAVGHKKDPPYCASHGIRNQIQGAGERS